MKFIIAVGDGMADNPLESLGGKTPLETAQHPMLDELAQKGTLGTVRTIPDGIAPGSDTAFLGIFGYDARKTFSGRGPLEAAGCGVPLNPGEIAYRCNIIALEDGEMPLSEKRILSHSGGNVHGDDALALMESVLNDAELSALLEKNNMCIHTMPAFRQIAVQQNTSLNGLCTIPPHDHLNEEAGPWLPSGGSLATELNAIMHRSHALLNHHPINEKRRKEGLLPANCLWFWAEGVAPALANFEQTNGVNGFVVSAVPLIHGIAALAGLSSVAVEGATGELDTNYEGKADAVFSTLKNGKDFALLHVEAPDECTHNGDLPGKIKAIEAFDARCVRRLIESLHKEDIAFRLLLLSDHKTLTETRGHDAEPVPFLLYDSRNPSEKQKGARYTEREAESGPFVQTAPELLSLLLSTEI